jgi:N-acetylglucosaminyldiphosphoundecaprenol N-acetyl-beta-D-mannosaminyltransferase
VTERSWTVDILGVPVTATSFAGALDEVSSWIELGQRRYGTFSSVHGIMESQRSGEVLAAHRAAGLVACDGMPLVWAARHAGAEFAERVYGPDFMLALCSRAAVRKWRCYLYGGAVDVAKALAENLTGLQLCGVASPPFRALTAGEQRAAVRAINASNAQIVWVGLGTPKQELWMAQHRGELTANALLGVGAVRGPNRATATSCHAAHERRRWSS